MNKIDLNLKIIILACLFLSSCSLNSGEKPMNLPPTPVKTILPKSGPDTLLQSSKVTNTVLPQPVTTFFPAITLGAAEQSLGNPETLTPLTDAQATATTAAAITPTPAADVFSTCIPLSTTRQTSGERILIVRQAVNSKFNLYKLNTATSERMFLGSATYAYAVSSDHTGIAFVDQRQKKLITINSKGEKQYVFPAKDSWTGTIKWTPDNQILIENESTPPQAPDAPSSIQSLNLINGEIRDFNVNYPNGLFTMLFGRPYWYGQTISSLSPLLDQVVYASNNDFETPLILWDIPNTRQILEIHTNGFLGISNPQWTDDGEFFIISAKPKYKDDNNNWVVNYQDDLPYKSGYDLFKISRSGQIERLTHLTVQHNAAELGLALSPDENSVAFWITADYQRMDTQWNLAILDLATRNVKNYCLSLGNTEFPIQLVWSPDGKEIMATIAHQTSNSEKRNIVIVNLEQNSVIDLSNDETGLAWLK